MTIEEFGDVICTNLDLTRYHGQNNRWTAKFHHADTINYKGHGIRSGTHGNGKTPAGAIQDYINQISGKILVFDGNDERIEYGVPSTLTYKES